MEKMERVKTRTVTVQGDNSANEHIPKIQLNMNKISVSIKAIRERLTSLAGNLEQLQQQVTHLQTISKKLECLTSHTEQLTTLSSMCEELQSITQLTQEVNSIREGLTALDNVVYNED